MAGEMPNSLHPETNPKSNNLYSPNTASNKSPQTPQAAAQDVPAGRADGTAAAGLIAGAGSGKRQITNGKNGRASFRK